MTSGHHDNNNVFSYINKYYPVLGSSDGIGYAYSAMVKSLYDKSNYENQQKNNALQNLGENLYFKKKEKNELENVKEQVEKDLYELKLQREQVMDTDHNEEFTIVGYDYTLVFHIVLLILLFCLFFCY